MHALPATMFGMPRNRTTAARFGSGRLLATADEISMSFRQRRSLAIEAKRLACNGWTGADAHLLAHVWWVGRREFRNGAEAIFQQGHTRSAERGAAQPTRMPTNTPPLPAALESSWPPLPQSTIPAQRNVRFLEHNASCSPRGVANASAVDRLSSACCVGRIIHIRQMSRGKVVNEKLSQRHREFQALGLHAPSGSIP